MSEQLKSQQKKVIHLKCDECQKTFAGFTTNQVNHQLKVHKISKHS